MKESYNIVCTITIKASYVAMSSIKGKGEYCEGHNHLSILELKRSPISQFLYDQELLMILVAYISLQSFHCNIFTF